ncbi:hypothetical protein RCC89_14570 [Cytophagaceae bacterium ABcell3]|nr:hypothetical protein RCC89_14570 [Cytophagaceae bacterium ABcell3]
MKIDLHKNEVAACYKDVCVRTAGPIAVLVGFALAVYLLAKAFGR